MRFPAEPPQEGWIGRYQLLRKLAQGGMAELFAAIEVLPGGAEREVAIKQIRPHLRHDPSIVTMFLDEARVLARLQHPNIVHVLEIGEHQGLPFFAMELLEGLSVGDLRRKAAELGRPLSANEILHVALGACDGLHHAHHRRSSSGAPLGIVHRDVTPQNLFVTRDGSVKVLDFGVAYSRDKAAETRTGAIKGTLRYMAPEQCRALPLDARVDVFALSAVLWELFANAPLFTGASDLAVMRAIADADAPRLSTVLPTAPPALVEVLARGLARDRDARYPSVQALRTALEAVAAELDLRPSSRELAQRVDDVLEVDPDLTTIRSGSGVDAEPEPAPPPAPVDDVERTRSGRRPQPGDTDFVTRPALSLAPDPPARSVASKAPSRARWLVAVAAVGALVALCLHARPRAVPAPNAAPIPAAVATPPVEPSVEPVPVAPPEPKAAASTHTAQKPHRRSRASVTPRAWDPNAALPP